MKKTKEAVNYRNGTLKARCGSCAHFNKKAGSCSVVRGMINAGALCDAYEGKKA